MNLAALTLLFSSVAAFSPPVYNDINRRDVLQKTATILTTGATVVATTLVTKPEEALAFGSEAPLFKKVQQLETANYLPGKPLYPPNVNGAPEKHIPNVLVNGNDIEVSANHVMTEEHYIQVSIIILIIEYP